MSFEQRQEDKLRGDVMSPLFTVVDLLREKGIDAKPCIRGCVPGIMVPGKAKGEQIFLPLENWHDE